LQSFLLHRENFKGGEQMSKRRIFDIERHAQFITFSYYKRRKLLNTDPAKK